MNQTYKVIVSGSINMDVVATADVHPSTGQTVPGKSLDFFPGGKGANQAVAAAKSGAHTVMIGKLGWDAFGDQLESFLRNQGVHLALARRAEDVSTGTALIVVAGGDNTIVVVPGANGLLRPTEVTTTAVQKGDILVSQFEVPLETIQKFFQNGKQYGATTILNPAPAMECPRELLALVDVLVLNETELSFFSGSSIPADAEEHVVIAKAKELRVHGDQVIVVTLGARGALAVLGEREIRVPGHPVTVLDTTGAGDCFVGNLAAKLAGGATLEQALRSANLAASICVQRMGAGPSMPTREEVESLEREEALV